MCCESGQLSILKVLKSKEADPNIKTHMGQTCLHIACYHGNLNCVDYLVRDIKMDPNQLLEGKTRSNCLHIAVTQQNIKIVKLLLDHSEVNLRTLTSNGDDSLMISIKSGNFPMFKYLLYTTVKNKYLKQLDFNNGNGDPPDSEYNSYMQNLNPPYLVDINYKFKHKNSLM